MSAGIVVNTEHPVEIGKMFELSGHHAQCDSYERCARQADRPMKTWRVRYRHLGSFSGSSIWTDARTRHGAIASVFVWRRSACLPTVEIISIEEEER